MKIKEILLGLLLVFVISVIAIDYTHEANATHHGADYSFPSPDNPGYIDSSVPNIDCNAIGADPVDGGNLGGDTDLDGICNDWEPSTGSDLTIRFKYPYTTGTVYQYTYDCNCADPNKRDVFVELDWLLYHAPSAGVITDVINAFSNAPTPINLHIQYGETASSGEINFHKDLLKTFSSSSTNPGFYRLKQYWFGTQSEREPNTGSPDFWTTDTLGDVKKKLTAKRQVFHYGMFIHKQYENAASSGWAEITGNDFVVSLGSFTNEVGSVDQQEGTFMHELGHNLGLRHGGNQDFNCKPNYLSIMNYAFQFKESHDVNRPLDYSRVQFFDSLNENSLISESPPNIDPAYTYNDGTPRKTVWSLPVSPYKVYGYITQGANWNNVSPTNEAGYAQNVNSLSGCANTALTNSLTPFNDWNNLAYEFATSGNFASGASSDEYPDGPTEKETVTLDTMPEDASGAEYEILTYAGGASEITMDIVRDYRHQRLIFLGDVTQKLPDNAFRNPEKDKETLDKFVTEAMRHIQNDDLGNAKVTLEGIKNQVNMLINEDYEEERKQILEFLDDNILAFNIASDVGKRPPDEVVKPCRENFVPLIKNSDSSLVCIKPTSVDKLVRWGFGHVQADVDAGTVNGNTIMVPP